MFRLLTTYVALRTLVAAIIILVCPASTTAIEFDFPSVKSAAIFSIAERKKEVLAIYTLFLSYFIFKNLPV